MYDLALLEAIKYQSPTVLDSNQIRPKQFIYKKYKIDSLQLAQNNVYYAADYKNYKIMFEAVVKRVTNEKKRVNALIKLEQKKNKIQIAKLKKIKELAKKTKDSIAGHKLKK
jgi:rRNA maturation endonuclease Nob1